MVLARDTWMCSTWRALQMALLRPVGEPGPGSFKHNEIDDSTRKAG